MFSQQLRNINMTRETRVLGPLEQRVNFAHALLRGLQEVESEYVLVVQHDRVFSEKFSMNLGLNV